ncbi:MAG: protein translocase SEC61 complex subunit gamma [Candidatus Micrarchaeota archaeon]|nr:protein translocase SEC61 complex subunit gamma [Candidatus Micrarchaeota archaeon]
MNVPEMVTGFIKQSERVIAITHKPRAPEFKQMALTTAIGITIIGLIGFFINLLANAL